MKYFFEILLEVLLEVLLEELLKELLEALLIFILEMFIVHCSSTYLLKDHTTYYLTILLSIVIQVYIAVFLGRGVTFIYATFSVCGWTSVFAVDKN